MRKSRFVQIIALVFVVSVIASCRAASPLFPSGDYIDSEGFVTSFTADGRFAISSSLTGQIFVENGQYTVDGDTVTITETEMCPPGVGVYKWSQDGEKLQLELVEDNCLDRIPAITRELTLYHPTE